jgi:hypothetical protein
MVKPDQVGGFHSESVGGAVTVLEVDFENAGFQHFHYDTDLTADQSIFGYVPQQGHNRKTFYICHLCTTLMVTGGQEVQFLATNEHE